MLGQENSKMAFSFQGGFQGEKMVRNKVHDDTRFYDTSVTHFYLLVKISVQTQQKDMQIFGEVDI